MSLISIAVIAIMATRSRIAFSATSEQHAKKIENVLDKLEQRLLDKEASPLTFEEEQKPAAAKSDPARTTQKYSPKSPARVTGQTPGGKNLQELQKKINEYDNRIEILESDLRKMRASVYEGSVADNQIMLEIRAGNTSKFIIRTVTARLDGNILYTQLDPAGLWMPTRSIPVFYGPLQPGEHRMDVAATLAPLSEDGLELPTWKQKAVQQSFSFTIPDGKVRKNLIIEINDTKGDGSQPVASLVEAPAK